MSTNVPYDEQVLLQEVAGGNEQAFQRLFETYRDRLYYYISGFVKSEQVAEELVLDVFMKIWLGRDLVMQIEKFDSFLFRIAHNKSLDFLRSAARDEKMKQLLKARIESLVTNDADSELLVKEFEEKLREAINLMPEKRRQAYLMSKEQDMSYDEIAAKMSISRNTVSNHIVEAHKFIRSYLAKRMDVAIVILLMAEETRN